MREVPSSVLQKTFTTPHSKKTSDTNFKQLPHKLCVPTNIYLLEPVYSRNLAKNLDPGILLSNEFAKNDATIEFQNHFTKMGAKNVQVIPISIETTQQVLKDLHQKFTQNQQSQLDKSNPSTCIFNLCDGTEEDGYPGLSVVAGLEILNLPYTGSNPYFYNITTSKPNLKRALQLHKVETSSFIEILVGNENDCFLEAEKMIGYPMIIKPSISYASLSITRKSVVHNFDEAVLQAKKVLEDNPNGVFVEEFLAGREFTVLCTGDENFGVFVYPAAERVFHKKLGTFERFLAFDQYWDGYDLETMTAPDLNSGESFYKYEMAPSGVQERLVELARRAYLACGGYGRVDIRTRGLEGFEPFVLEVNANCGISFIPNSSTTAEILQLSKVDPEVFLSSMCEYSCNRQAKK